MKCSFLCNLSFVFGSSTVTSPCRAEEKKGNGEEKNWVRYELMPCGADTSRKGGESETDQGWEMQFPDGRTLADTFAVSNADLVTPV